MQALISTVSCRAEETVPSALFQHDRDATLQALTVTMAVATSASALSVRYGLAAISSLTLLCRNVCLGI